MLSRTKEWVWPGILALIALGFQASPIESMTIAVILWSLAGVWALSIIIRSPAIWTRLAFVKIEIQSSGIMGVYPPLPDSPFGKMEPLQVKFRLSSWLKVHPEFAVLYVRKNGFTSINFYQEDGKISGASFAIPINWFKGKTNKAYMIVSAKGKEWRSKEFEIKIKVAD